MCVWECVGFSAIWSLFLSLCQSFFFSNEGQKADGHTRSTKQALSTGRMFKVFSVDVHHIDLDAAFTDWICVQQ